MALFCKHWIVKGRIQTYTEGKAYILPVYF